MNRTPQENFIELCTLTAARQTLRKLTLSKPLNPTDAQRTVGRLSLLRGQEIIAFEETLGGGKVRHTACPISDLAAELPALLSRYGQANLSTGAGDAELRCSKKGKAVLLGATPILRAMEAGGKVNTFVESLNREKHYTLSGKEDFLIRLGVSDKNGRIHDKKQGKYRQINRFLEHVEEIYSALPAKGPLLVYDLCCGKSYLSFAVYFYLTQTKGREVEMLCMDLKEDVMRDCAAIAGDLGYDGMHFVAGDIRLTPRDKSPHLVISLHACDIATDIVLDTATALGAEVILSTPCCHRYLNDKLQYPALEFVSRYPHLRGKLCEALTEGIRLARLRAAGYTVTALEMTDPDDTPKNTLLRAVRRHNFSSTSPEAEALRREYDALLHMLLGDNAPRYLKEILI